MSTKTGRAPSRTKALAVETNVNDGRITSSPGPRSQSIAAISSAAVHEGVISTLRIPNRSSMRRPHRLVNGPSPPIFPERIASETYCSSLPVKTFFTKGMPDVVVLFLLSAGMSDPGLRW